MSGTNAPGVVGPLLPAAQTTQDRLLAALSRVHDISPTGALAFRLSYLAGSMQWTIVNDTLTTVVVGGGGAPLSIDLSQYTLATLTSFIASQPGYQILFLNPDLQDLSALTLVPGTNDIGLSNGDHLYAATNPTWTYLAAIAAELAFQQKQIELLPAEMATTTADGEWLDLLGSYYAVPRTLGEADTQYSPRIPSEVILPRQNNVAISSVLTAATGQPAVVTNAPIYGNPSPAFDGKISFSGAPHFFNASARIIYNLFDVSIGYDILGSSTPIEYQALVIEAIDRLRAAGTHLRNLTLTPSVVGDTVNPATDGFAYTVSILSLLGTGNSSDSAIGTLPGIYGNTATSRDSAIGVLSTGIPLIGQASGSDYGLAFIAGAASSMTGLSSSHDTTAAAITTAIPLHQVATSSVDSARGALLSGIKLAGTGSSADSTTALLRSIANPLAGAGSSVDSASATRLDSIVTRNYYDHPGGANSPWNLAFGSNATWSVDGDLDQADARHGGFINDTNNYGCPAWVNLSTTSPVIEVKGSVKYNYVSATSYTTTNYDLQAHLVQGSAQAGPTGGDNPYGFFDTINYPGIAVLIGGGNGITNVQAGQGPFTPLVGYDDATSDLWGNMWDQQSSSYNKMAGLIRGYDLDPLRNPNYPQIRHGLQYMTDKKYFKSNSGNETDGPLGPASWPQLFQDYQGTAAAPSGNFYTGNLLYGSTLGIPISVVQPAKNPLTGNAWTTAGNMLFWNMQHFPMFPRDQASTQIVLLCDQQVTTSYQSWLYDADTDLPALVQMLRVLRNQHQGGQSYVTYPANGPGTRVSPGPPPLAVIGAAAPGSPSGTVVNYAGPTLVDSVGETWSLINPVNSYYSLVLNGTVDPSITSVGQILYYNGLVYVQTTGGVWQHKTRASNPSWIADSADPRPAAPPPATPSPDGTVVNTAGPSLVDIAGETWTLANPVGSYFTLMLNGAADTSLSNVNQLLYYNGLFYVQTGGMAWQHKTRASDASWIADSADPRPAAKTFKVMPMGDSVTAGGGNPPPPGSYRAPLYAGLVSAGYTITYVGDQTSNSGGGLPTTEYEHEGLGGYGVITIQNDQNNPGIYDYIIANNILSTYTPDIILLMIGVNNFYVAAPANIGPTATFTNLKTLINYIFTTLPKVKIIMGTISANPGDLGVPTSNANAASEDGAYNYMILNSLTTAINNPNLSVVDPNGAMNADSRGVSALVGSDNLHPNAAGNQIIANVFLAGIEALSTIAAPTPASPSGTVVNYAGPTMVDSAGESWSMANPVGNYFTMMVNGVADYSLSNVGQLLYYNGLVYVQTSGYLWQHKTRASDASWIADSADPRPATPPPAVGATALSVTSPAASSTATGTITVTGVAGSTWVNVTAFDAGGHKIATADNIPSNNQFTLSVNTTSLANGSETITISAFSVPAGGSGGTSSSVPLVVNVSNTGSGGATGPTVMTAAAFIKAIGVNTHVTYSDSYASQSLFMTALEYSGIKRVRDVIPSSFPSGLLAQMLLQGITFTYGPNATAGTTPAQFVSSAQTFINSYPGVTAGFEGPNEVVINPFAYKSLTQPYAATAQYQKDLYAAIRAVPAFNGIPVICFSTGTGNPTGFAQFGDMSSYCEWGNAHIYPQQSAGGGVPPYSSVQNNLSWQCSNISPNKPTAMTECGYYTMPDSSYGVNNDVQAKYIASMLFDIAIMGSLNTSNTYYQMPAITLYELLDEINDSGNTNREYHFGLFNYDGTHKPAAVAVHNITTVLADTGTATTGRGLTYSVSGMPTSSHSTQFVKANGRQYVVVWAEPTIWNQSNDIESTASSSNVTVTLDRAYSTVNVYDVMLATPLTTTYSSVNSVVISVSDHPIIVEAY